MHGKVPKLARQFGETMQILSYHYKLIVLDRLLSPDIVQFRSACLRTEIFLRELTLSSTLSSNPKLEFPLRRPAVFSQTAILCSLNSRQIFHCSTTRIDADTRLHNSKWLIRVNQSPHLTKDRFA